MQRACEDCGASYDDAVSWTICPHERFISHEGKVQKDLAHSLSGKQVVFKHLYRATPQTPRRVIAVSSSTVGTLVELQGMSGQFAPELFEVVGS
jgi:hypothetical protein